jgi:hypothetical protein
VDCPLHATKYLWQAASGAGEGASATCIGEHLRRSIAFFLVWYRLVQWGVQGYHQSFRDLMFRVRSHNGATPPRIGFGILFIF